MCQIKKIACPDLLPCLPIFLLTYLLTKLLYELAPVPWRAAWCVRRAGCSGVRWRPGTGRDRRALVEVSAGVDRWRAETNRSARETWYPSLASPGHSLSYTVHRKKTQQFHIHNSFNPWQNSRNFLYKSNYWLLCLHYTYTYNADKSQ